MILLKLLKVLQIFTLINITLSADHRVNEFLTVKTRNGDVRGKLQLTLFDKKPYYSFRGIPFAQPPTGELRFKRPVPVSNWTGVRDAFEFGGECLQFDSGVEDCLYLNIFAPANITNEKLPVMFFIYGGAFITGSSNMYGPDFLLEHNVIMVSANYRLGVLGFMSLGTAEYSGNMGFKDQLLALQWTNENIELFGGDKSKITIFGESAGSASVSLIAVSHKSRGLFQRAIMQSGVAINPFPVYMGQNHLNIMMEFGKKFGNITENIDDLIDFLKVVDEKLFINELTESIYITNTSRKDSNTKWAAVVEAENAVDPFLTELPIDVLKRPFDTDIDVFLGFNSAEMYTIAIDDVIDPSLLKPFDQYFEIMLPKSYLKFDFDSEEYRKIARDIRKFYFPRNVTVGKDTITEYITLLSDIWFVYGTVDLARMQYYHSTGKTYLYQFSVEAALGILQVMGFDIKELNIKGAAHGDELFYLFKMSLVDYDQLAYDSVEIKIIELITRLWTNFAKYGTPTLPTDLIQFKAIEDGIVNYGDIRNDGLVLGIEPFRRNIRFWDNLYAKYEDVFEQHNSN